MTDREEFEKWFKAKWNADYYPTEAMYLAWQARGELDAVHIKEWQSLSDEEIEELYGDCSIEYFRDIEMHLKEKNND